jgi:tetratricopeptide (TPR) repeat protein
VGAQAAGAECTELTDPEVIEQVNAARQEGKRLFGARRYSDAVTSYEVAITAYPCDAATFYNAGLAYSRLSRTEEAIDALGKAVELDPSHMNARLNIANALLRSGALDLAGAKYQETKTLATEDDKIVSQCEHGLLSVATKHLKAANNALRRKRYGETITRTEQAIVLNPNLSKAYILAGKAHLAQRTSQHLTQAAQMFEQAGSVAHTARDSAASLQGLGDVARKQGYAAAKAKRQERARRKWRTALGYYTRSLALESKSKAALINAGDLYVKLRRYQEATEVLQRAVAMDSNSRAAAGAYRKLAESYNALGRCPQAESAARSSLGIVRTDASSRVALGEALRCQGKSRQAISEFQMAARNRRWKAYADHQVKEMTEELNDVD